MHEDSLNNREGQEECFVYCGHCGRPIQNGAEFCPNCGKPAEDQTGRQAVQGRQAYYRQCMRKRRWRHAKQLMAVLVVLLALLAAGEGAYWWWTNLQSEEPVTVAGRGSYTTLIADYLTAAQAEDLETISSLFFPGSENFYQNAEGDRPLSQILTQEDKWAGNYGKEVSDMTLGTAQFADLDGRKADSVAKTIQAYSGIEAINELYSVQGTVAYADGSAVSMVFEVVQCEQGCFLVTIEGSAV